MVLALLPPGRDPSHKGCVLFPLPSMAGGPRGSVIVRSALESESMVHFRTAPHILGEKGGIAEARSLTGWGCSVVELALLAEGRGGGQQKRFGGQLGF